MIYKYTLNRMIGSKILAGIWVLALVALICGASPVLAATAPALLSNSSFAVTSSTLTITNPTTLNGNVCWTTPSVNPPAITGSTLVPCVDSQVSDQSSALATINGQTCTALGAAVDLASVSIGGGTPGIIPPGCYFSTGSMNIGSTVHLSGSGVYVFRSAALGTAANSTVFLDNGACANNVFWAPGAATTLAANSTFSGTIIDNAGITIGNLATVQGRLIASGGTITMNADTITVPTACESITTKLALVTTVTNTGGGTATAGQFTLTATGDATTGPTVITGTTPVAAINAPNGVYTLTVKGPTGYKPSYSCSGGGTLAFNKLTITSADAGNTITCTITNTWSPATTANLSLLTTVTNTGGGTSTAGQFMLTATGDITTGPTVITGTTPVAAASAPLGVYTLTETGPAGYAPTYSCSGGGTLAGNQLTITSADAGNSIACTIRNTWIPAGTANLSLLTTVNNTGGGTATVGQFILKATGGSSTGPTVITGTTPLAAIRVPVGVYTLSEAGPTGYSPVYSCTGGGTLAGDNLTITSADAGNTITCTIANAWTPAGTIVLGISKTGTGIGTVTSSDGNISCGNNCAAAYTSTIATTLTATATTGSSFTGWSGGGCSGTGTCKLNSGTGVVVTANFTISPTIIVKGDFSGTHKASLVWRNFSTGENTIWDNVTTVSSIELTSLPIVTDTDWKLVGVGNFGSGFETDILWRHQTAGYNVVWYMTGGTARSGGILPTVTDTNWTIAGTGNFSGTGNTDILWRNTSTGANAVWHMSGITPQSEVAISPVADTNWVIAGTGDFKGDNSTTILWRNQQTGNIAYWYMSGTTVASIGALPALTVVDTDWEIVSTGDFDGDGKPDILWRNKTYGYDVLWLMNGTTIKSVQMLLTIPLSSWHIVGPR
ncbi:ice-binding family protein [Candidatus Magnetominusculus dajiuhuensis]|uniref:ice-binding family protein n=1 Tax=Candidatus Magnetominusculus dajiuhuensis TaxID=3137712 RepID=UPI003B42AB17